MELRPAYKQTEIGVFPSDWEVVAFGGIVGTCIDYRGRTPRKLGMDWGGGDVLALSANNVQMGRIAPEKEAYFGSEELYRKWMRQGECAKGDVLLTMEAPLGNVAQIPDSQKYILSQRVILIKPNARIGCDFLFHLLQGAPFQEMLEQNSTGSTAKGIQRAKLEKLEISFPKNAPEQSAIATALGDADRLLAALDALIAKKRAIKQGAMQELLTGKRRLPGFSGEWEMKRLGDHLKFLGNGANSRAELMNDGRVRYLHYGDIHGSNEVLLNPTTTAMPFLPQVKAVRLDRLRDGDLVFVDASEDLDGVGKSVELQSVGKFEVVSGMHTIAVRFDRGILADGFKAYLQFIPLFQAHLRRLASGTKVYATNMSHIASAEVELPSPTEQVAISAVLTDMDTELTALEGQRTKTAQLKQGMMQTLLTGRIRLV